MKFKLVVTDLLGTRSVVIKGLPLTIGRGSANQFQVVDAQVSRQHAELFLDGETLSVRDCGSRYGTFVNGTPVEGSAAIALGDELHVGQTVIRLHAMSDAEISDSLPAAGLLNALRASTEAVAFAQAIDDALAAILDAALAITGGQQAALLLDSEPGLTMRLVRPVASSLSSDVLRDLQAQQHFETGRTAALLDRCTCIPVPRARFASGGGHASTRHLGVLYVQCRNTPDAAVSSALQVLAIQLGLVLARRPLLGVA